MYQIYAGLLSWKTGTKIDIEKFDRYKFDGVYILHMEHLATIRQTNVGAYHMLMSRLYSGVM